MSTALTTTGQYNNFDTLTDDLLLRIRSYNTDSTTRNFLKKYVPFIATKPKPSVWTAYPPTENVPPDVMARHSLVFPKHPFVDFEMEEGRLDILTREREGEVVSLLTYYISISFSTRKQAEQAFDNLRQMFTSISTSNQVLQKHHKSVAVFRNKRNIIGPDNKDFTWTDEMQVVLTQDELIDSKYKIVFGTVLHPKFIEHYGIQQQL